MKKVLFILSLVLLCSCDFILNSKSGGSDTINSKEGTVPVPIIKTFKYKGHSYILFASREGGGVVHDPECQYCYDKFD